MTDPIDRLAPTLRPAGWPVMRQRWSDLLFLHWPVPAEALRPLVPPPLQVDTFEGQAYVGLVPFLMSGVRPTWAPPVRGLSRFPEVNVRTYVHLDGRDPGVWFFSLDAANAAAVRIARGLFHLPYHYASMGIEKAGSTIRYRSDRRWPGPTPAGCRVEWEPAGPPTASTPGTREHFLAERYILYSVKGRKLYRGRVHHPPYPLQPARVLRLEENLVAAAGIERPDAPPLAHHADEVRVRVYPLKLATTDRPRTHPAMLRLALVMTLLAGTAAAQPADGRRPFAKPGTPRRAERIRTFDVKHIRADLTIDLARPEIRGTVAHTLSPLHPGLATVGLDCGAKLKVEKVDVDGKPAAFQHDGEALAIALPRPLEADQEAVVAITYAGRPDRGLYFVAPDPGRPQDGPAAWSQGAPEESGGWLPCYNFPNDRASTEINVTVAKPYTAVSNGALVETKDNGATRTFRWKLDVPHVSYLISVAVADFNVFHDDHNGLPLDYYVGKGVDEATARRAFGKTPKIVAFFDEVTGKKYPYPKYAQVVVPEFTWGGMENISATTMNDVIIRDPVASTDGSMDGLVAHELAHQWFGNLVTCRDWAHIWLNEGFASYFDPLYMEREQGTDAFRVMMAGVLRGYLGQDRGYRRPIVESRYDDVMDIFDGVAYAKGACVLHALRGVVGDAGWWAGIRKYVEDNQGKVVDTDDFQKAMESASGKDLKWFFDQWTRKAGHPELKLKWRYEAEDKTVRINVEQGQKLDDQTPIFRLPTTLHIEEGGKFRVVPVVVDKASMEFVVPAAVAPKFVLIDPEGWIPKTLTVDQPEAAWLSQLSMSADILPRLAAARWLSGRRGPSALKALTASYERDAPKRGQADASKTPPEARRLLVEAIAGQGDAARGALIGAVGDADARVRVEAVEDLAGLGRSAEAEASLRSVWADEREAYRARVAALRGLAGWKVADRVALRAQGLKVRSDRETVAAAALDLTLAEGGNQAREAAVAYAAPGRPAALRRQAVEALGRLAGDDPAIQDQLIKLAADASRPIRWAAWQALAGANVKRSREALIARRPVEELVSFGRLDRAIAALTEASDAKATDVDADRKKADALDEQAVEHELKAREARHQAEAIRLKAERDQRPASKGPSDE